MHVHPEPAEAHRRATILAAHPELAVLIDLDGTLIPFARTAEEARLDDAGAAALEALERAGIRVVIVSGRPQPLVEAMRERVPRAWWFAEHGSWRCDGSGVWTGPGPERELDELYATLSRGSAVPGARLERKSLSLCLHWRMTPIEQKEELIAAAELACDEWLETHRDHERIAGVEMLEVRRRTANKGAAVAWVRDHLPGCRIIAIGDDHTDEDMFAALHAEDLAVGVGPRPSMRLGARIADPIAVRAFLGWLAETRASGVAPPFPGFAPARTSGLPARARLLISTLGSS